MKKCWIFALLVFLVAVATAVPVLGKESGSTTPPTSDEEFENSVVAVSIVEAFPKLGLTAEQVQAYKDAGWGYGEVTIAAALASKAGKTVDEILALYETGKGWGQIAKSLGLGKLGPIISGVVSNGKAHRKGHSSDPALEETASTELARKNHGQSKEKQERMTAQYKITHREFLTACTTARASGDAAALQTALEMRAQHKGWQQIMDKLRVNKAGVLNHGKGNAKDGKKGETKHGSGQPGQGEGTGHGK